MVQICKNSSKVTIKFTTEQTDCLIFKLETWQGQSLVGSNTFQCHARKKEKKTFFLTVHKQILSRYIGPHPLHKQELLFYFTSFFISAIPTSTGPEHTQKLSKTIVL